MAVVELHSFRKKWRKRLPGKGGRRWEIREETIPVVTVVSRDSVDGFLNTRTLLERTEHLRGLRDLGVLVHNSNSLKQTVRDERGGRLAAYVFRAPWEAVPRRRRRSQRFRARSEAV